VSEIYLSPDTLKAGEPDWDPAGNRLCFTADDPNGARNLWLMTLSGTSVVSMRRLTTEGVHDVNPRFSPDGTKIVFRSDRSGKSGVWWVSPDSAQMAPRLIAFEDVERTIVSPAWSPDGTELVVSSGAKNPTSLLGDDRALFILSNLGF
jgi:Tol biopolymer transport system component